MWGEDKNVTVLPGGCVSLGEGEGGVEDWESDDSCPARDVVGSSSSLKTSRVIMLSKLFMANHCVK